MLFRSLVNFVDGATKNVGSGNWQIFVRDTNGCTQNTTLLVGMDPQPSIAKVNVHDFCNDNADYPISGYHVVREFYDIVGDDMNSG